MQSVASGIDFLQGTGSRLLFGWDKSSWQGDKQNDNLNPIIPTFQEDDELMTDLKNKVFAKERLEMLTDEQIIKICRQLEFWYCEKGGNLKSQSSNDDFLKLAEDLVDQSLWYREDGDIVQVPKVRFGKTELQMPVVTCGGMRLQNTWMPDFVPVLRPSRKTVLTSTAQDNVKECIRACMKLGVNHFETARMYGTSEYQMVEALHELINEGEFKREDFIFQTKVIPLSEKRFRQFWEQSWANIKDKLGYVDLLSIHGLVTMTKEAEESLMVAEELKKEGKVR